MLSSNAGWEALCAEQDKKATRNPNAKCGQADPRIRLAVEKKAVKTLATDANFFKLSRENFAQVLTILLHVEVIHRDIEMRRYDQPKVRIKLAKQTCRGIGRGPLFQFDLVGLSRGQPKLVPGDYIILDNGLESPEQFVIEEIVGDSIKFRRVSREGRKIEGIEWDLSFHSSAVPFERCVENLRVIEGWEMLKQMLFMGGRQRAAEDRGVSNQQVTPKIDAAATKNAYVDARLAKCNERQRQAILQIMEGAFRPNLYIIFGPPGTGKTFTLIETVGQIFQRNPESRILVCANSNNCVDDLATKLLESNCLKAQQLIRVCGLTYYRALVANHKQNPVPEFFTDDPLVAKSKRVVLTTNIAVYKLYDKFDFVFVDEAGHANIPESLLPCSRVKEDGCFVLAGDPKQLGPVVRSREAGKLGLNESLLKRMFGEYLYGKHGGEYNKRYITKLVDAYRCDPRILGLCNQLFYQDELNCLGETPPEILAMMSEIVSERNSFPVEIKNPLVFYQVGGQETRLECSSSCQNDIEAEVCLDLLFRFYREGLKPDQIGVITYYGLQKVLLNEKYEQRLKIEKDFLDWRFKKQKQPQADPTPKQKLSYLEQLKLHARRQLNQLKRMLSTSTEKPDDELDWRCMIDTVDAFQGREKEVIIISTTRTPRNSGEVSINNAGFLTDAKRFNVAISRAKWLAVVVGHEACLDTCRYWRVFQKAAQLVYQTKRSR